MFPSCGKCFFHDLPTLTMKPVPFRNVSKFCLECFSGAQSILRIGSMTTTTWRESASSGYESIDKTNGIIRGAKVIGNVSRNGRRYPEKTLREALPLYEGSRIYLDHTLFEGKAKPVSMRSIKERWGTLKNVRAEDGGLRADIHYLTTHPLTPVLLEMAEKFSDTFGLSHDASGDEVSIPGGLKEVTKIHKVNSVDIVNDPATNSGLFESKGYPMRKTFREIAQNKAKFAKILEEMIAGDPMMGDMPIETSMDEMDDAGEPMEATPDEQVSSAFKAAMVAVLDDAALDIPGKLAKLKTIMQASDTAMAAIMGEVKTKTPPVEKDAADDEPTTEGADSKDGNLKEELNTTKAELEALKTEIECRKLLESASRAVTPIRLKSLASLPAADRQALVESWGAIRNPATKPSVSKSVLTEGVDDLYGETGEYKPKTREEFMKSIG